jgi:para-nitrobenzyl esterase
MTEELLTTTTRRLVPEPTELIQAYRRQFPDASPAQLWVQIQSDWFCSTPTARLIDARAAAGADCHVYEFAWRPEAFSGQIGACHTLELPFVFDTLSDPWGMAVRGEDAPQSLADEVHAAWCEFVASGDPGWPLHGPQRLVRRFAVPSALVTDPSEFRRRVWESIQL